MCQGPGNKAHGPNQAYCSPIPATPICLHIVYDCFYPQMAQVSSGNRESITLKDKNICHMAFSRENLHTLNLCNKSSRIHKLEWKKYNLTQFPGSRSMYKKSTASYFTRIIYLRTVLQKEQQSTITVININKQSRKHI